MDHSFHHTERLKSRKTIGRLFQNGVGQSYVAYPLRVVWVRLDDEAAPTDFPAQVALSVSKRTFKTAVMRNRLKRQIREAYRLHKRELYEKLNAAEHRVALMLMYVAKEPLPFSEIEKGVAKAVRKWPGPSGLSG
jgi:ribonuclease P protein component